MQIFIVFFALIQLSLSQFNMTPFARLPQLTSTQQIVFSSIRKNATQVYVSVQQAGTYKIVKWNTANASNVFRVGEYASPINPPWPYYYLYFFKGYIMASSLSDKPQVFNQTTFAYMGEVNLNLVFERGYFIQSKNTFFFGTTTGNVGYFTLSNFPNITPVYLFNESSSDIVFIQTSLDQQYVCVSFFNSNYILIYRTSDWALAKNITVSSVRAQAQAWSGDSRYLMVFLYNEIYVLVYDRDTNWSLVENQTIGHKNILTCFYYEETNIVVALSVFSSAVILINWDDFSVSLSYNTSGWLMSRSDTKESMTIFQGHNQTTSWYFNISPFCPSNKFYNIPLKTCVQCDNLCSICNSTTTCKQCITDYTVVNGKCEQCSVGTVYNVTTYLCDDCSSNCLTCTSVSVCTSCIAGGTVVNASCVMCDLGYVYNFTLWACQVNCTQNCVTCASNSSCSVCSAGYNVMSDGSCQICPSRTFYNSINNSCQSCSSNCNSCNSESSCNSCDSGAHLSNGSCIYCPKNCISCQTSSICTQCGTGFRILEGQCGLSQGEQAIMLELGMNLTISSDTFLAINKVPGSRSVIRQVSVLLMNIDHLWLYIYHKRQYGFSVDKLLTAVQNIGQEKWELISKSFLNRTLNFDMESIAKHMNFKVERTSWKFVQIQGQSSSFLENSLEYFLMNVPMLLVLFFLFKMLFNLLFKFQASIIFRQYAFNGYLLLMLIEGNSQSFTYFFMYDCRQLYQLNFLQKLFNLFTVFLFAIFFALLIASFFMLKATYGKNTKYFYDNCNDTLLGSTNLLIQRGLLNFGLGFVHLMAQDFYVPQLLMLSCIEALFIACIISSINRSKLYKFKYIEWQNLLGSFLRILLIFTFYVDRNSPGIYDPIQQAQMYLINIYLFNGIFSTVVSIFLVLKSAASFVIKYLFPQKDKKNISTLYENPHLSRFYHLARRQKKKINQKIQIIQGTPQFGQKNNHMKIEMMVKDKNHNAKISEDQRIQTQKVVYAPKNIFDQRVFVNRSKKPQRIYAKKVRIGM